MPSASSAPRSPSFAKAPLPPGAGGGRRSTTPTCSDPRWRRTPAEGRPDAVQPTSNAQTYLQDLYMVPAQGDFDAARIHRGDPAPGRRITRNTSPSSPTSPIASDLTTSCCSTPAAMSSIPAGVDLAPTCSPVTYRTTKLADAYRQAMRSTSVDDVPGRFLSVRPSLRRADTVGAHPDRRCRRHRRRPGAATQAGPRSTMCHDRGPPVEEDGLGRPRRNLLAGATN